MKWISVEERLPPFYEDVLVSLEWEHKQLNADIDYYNGERWGIYENNTRISHWMHLPDPPKPRGEE